MFVYRLASVLAMAVGFAAWGRGVRGSFYENPEWDLPAEGGASAEELEARWGVEVCVPRFFWSLRCYFDSFSGVVWLGGGVWGIGGVGLRARDKGGEGWGFLAGQLANNGDW